MYQQYPNIAMTSGGSAGISACLEELLPEIWRKEIDREFLGVCGSQCCREWLLSL